MGEKPSILIVDDDKNLTSLMQHELENQGYSVTTASNGADGLERLKSMFPSLIILDVNMPKMNGIDFFRMILGNDNRPRYPVLVLTTRAEFEEIFRDVNAAGFIAKPFLIKQFEAEVRRIIANPPRLSDLKG